MGRARKQPPTWPDDDDAVADVLGVGVEQARRYRRGDSTLSARDLGAVKRVWPTVDVAAVCDWLLEESA